MNEIITKKLPTEEVAWEMIENMKSNLTSAISRISRTKNLDIINLYKEQTKELSIGGKIILDCLELITNRLAEEREESNSSETPNS